MSKHKTTFNCSNCAYISLKWLGCCPSCNEWNTIEEHQSLPSLSPRISTARAQQTTMQPIDSVTSHPTPRLISGISEWDRVLGGGIIPGSFIILSGDPGIGKSTLLLQVADKLASKKKVFYFSSEESLEQVKVRVHRTIGTKTSILFCDEGNLETIIATAEQHKPDVIVIDSLQNCFFTQSNATPGSISQLKDSGFALMHLAKKHTIAVLVTGHITKEGVIAGPKTLEHMVDAVFYLQAEDQWNTRVLRSVKNRFGPISELGFWRMGQEGLQEMPDINQQLLQEVSYSPGSALISCLEGSRPLLLEVQALTIPSKFGVPQRVITGVDHKRVILIAAILEKYLQVKLSAHDIFFKVSGGSKIQDSSSDLGIALALLSSYFQIPLREKSIALAEVSLTGQIKPINYINTHLNEAERFGIQQLFISTKQTIHSSLTALSFSNVYELLKLFTD